MLEDKTQHLEGDCDCKVRNAHFQCLNCGAHSVDLRDPCWSCSFFKFRAVVPNSPDYPKPPKKSPGRPKKEFKW